MSIYRELLINPPALSEQVNTNPREVIFETISCMCDNRHFLKLKKNTEGDFKLNGNGFSISNWQMKHDKHDIEWSADEGKWQSVIDMINTGTSKIASIKSR